MTYHRLWEDMIKPDAPDRVIRSTESLFNAFTRGAQGQMPKEEIVKYLKRYSGEG